MTEVVRESFWTDEQRDLVRAYDRMVCPWCGYLLEECSDPEREWYPIRRFCYASADLAVLKRRYAEMHEDVEATGRARHPQDGVGLAVADVDPDGGKPTPWLR